jgi:pimeloyl-[acyl-carrier protein] synthase
MTSNELNATDALDHDLGIPENQSDELMLPALNAIRENDPVFWSEANHSWILTKHSHIVDAFRDRRFSSAGSFLFGMDQHVDLKDVPNLVKYSRNWLINMDGKNHINIRKVLMPVFSKASIDRYIPLIEEIALELVDEIASKGTVDYVVDVAFQLPARVITAILGLDRKHLDDIKRWSDILVLTILPQHLSRENLLTGERAMAAMNQLVLDEMDKRRSQPMDDLLTDFVQLVDSGALSLDEALATLQIVLVAGHDTTANSNVLALQALLKHPDQMAYFRANVDSAIDFIPELMRYTAISATQFRIALEDIEIDGKTISKGDFVLLSMAAANRDPAIFEAAETLDLTRDASKQLTFAPGFHLCLGHYLARLELSIYFKHLLQRFDNIAVPEQKTEQNGNFVFRGIQHLKANFS